MGDPMQELLRDAVRLLEGVVLPAAEADALARLLGSREELLAHLLLSRRSLQAFPEIIDELALAAAAVTSGPLIDRPEQSGDPARRRADYLALDAALHALFAETAGGEAHRKASSALQQFCDGATGAAVSR
jgi:hypothetical protein